jgi:hypothetical protein
MQKKIFLACLLVSVLLIASALCWRLIYDDDTTASLLFTAGWLSSLLVAGYYITPSGTTFGKIAFAAVVILVTGIGMKSFHIAHGDKIIGGALFTIAFTYMKMWMKAKDKT